GDGRWAGTSASASMRFTRASRSAHFWASGPLSRKRHFSENPMRSVRLLASLAILLVLTAAPGGAADDDLVRQLRDLDAKVFPPNDDRAKGLPQMLARDVQ